MNPKGGGFLSVAGTGNHVGASPSRSLGHRQDRVGCIVECDQPKGEQKGAYSLHPHQFPLVEDICINRGSVGYRPALTIVLPSTNLSSQGVRELVICHN